MWFEDALANGYKDICYTQYHCCQRLWFFLELGNGNLQTMTKRKNIIDIKIRSWEDFFWEKKEWKTCQSCFQRK
jgi:hypothetical protein